MQPYDLVVVGGGPAGSATAWQAASNGARVLVCDKATFPRDKPCGDCVTPRGVQLMEHMGLGDELQRFHRVERARLVAPRRQVEVAWPHGKVGMPDHGYVVARTVLDELLLRNAAAAGAEVREDVQVSEPIIDRGVVRGVRVRHGRNGQEDVPATLTVVADGMSSRVGRAAGLRPLERRPTCLAVRAQVDSERPDDGHLEIHMTMRRGRRLLPGYAWVFEMGEGRINIGVGYTSAYPQWRELKINDVMAQFVASLPAGWKLPSVPEMLRARQLQGWRLPVGFTVWPPWRPGLMAVGDAAGVAKPFTGSGISKAMQSGMLAANVATTVLSEGDPRQLGAYEEELQKLWGAQYRLGRAFVSAISRPLGMEILAGPVMRTLPWSTFVLRLLSDIRHGAGVRPDDASERLYRGLLGAAGRLPAGSPGPQRTDRVRGQVEEVSR